MNLLTRLVAVFYLIPLFILLGNFSLIFAHSSNNASVYLDYKMLSTTPDTVCGPFSSSPDLLIDDNNDPKDTISVSLGANRIITDLDLVIQINHSFLQDLDIRLTSPSGTTISIMEDQCDDNDTLFVQFDDESPSLVCNLATIGQFAPPNGMLSDFDNEQIDGDWILEIIDDASGDNGTLVSWCLVPVTEEVECFAPSGLQSGNITSTSATLSWNSSNIPPETNWDIELIPLGEDPTGIPNYPMVASNPFVPTGLDPATTYQYFIRAHCDVIASPWAGPGFFTTNLTNPSACSLNLTIPDNNCDVLNEFNMDVNSAPGMTMGVDVELSEVRIIIEHPWVSDLELKLTSPSGVMVPVSIQNGSSGDNYGILDSVCTGYTVFAAEACDALAVEEGVAPFSGVFIPDGNFSDFSDGSSPIGQWTLSLCDVAADDIGILQYVELVFKEPGCQAPSQVVADSVASEFAQLTWMPGNDCISTIIEYGPQGFTPGDEDQPGSIQSEVVEISCPGSFPYTLSGLSESTVYEVYIRQECGGGSYSANSCVVQFLTNCKTQAISEIENFDTLPTCPTSCGSSCSISGTWKNVTDDELEWLIDANGTTSSKTGPSDDISGGGNYIYIESFGSSCPDFAEGILRSNCMRIIAEQGVCHMSFYYHMYGEKINQLSLEISNDDGQNWNSLWSLSGDQDNEWFKQFIDLSSFHGDTVQFQFVGVNSDGSRADIALDEIVFYGSEDLGEPSYVYYPDADGDGFGSDVDSTISCSASAPQGYVPNKLDCNDDNAGINPASEEIPCNGIDENCNGADDDPIIGDPLVEGDTICSGTLGIFSVLSNPQGTFFWYNSPTDTTSVTSGQFVELVLEETTTLYVEDFSTQNMTECKSMRVPVTVVVHTTPQLDVEGPVGLCQGDSLDLNSIEIVDLEGAGGQISFHDAFPPTPENTLTETDYLLDTDTTFYIQSVTPNGCLDADSTVILVFPNPEASITAEGPLTLCSGKATQLQGHALGNTDSITFFWNNGFIDSTLIVFGSQNPGTTDIYTFTVVDSTGCSDTDSIGIFTSESISGASLDQITNVSVCDGNDGSFTVSPINGTGPYSYQWSGPVSGDTSNVDSTLFIDNLKQGVYQVTITDNSAADCPLIVPVVVINGPSVVVTNVNIIPVSCSDAQNGGIQLSVSGNDPDFLWSTMDTTSSISNLEGGTYSVTITGNSCEVTLENLEVTEPDSLGIANVLVKPSSCFGEDDGSIKLIMQGGTAPYFYDWEHGPTSSTVSNLEAGFYTVTISDLRGCSIVNSLFVPSPSPIGFGVDMVQSVSCNGNADGAIFITPFGGTAPYSFFWNNSSMQEDLEDLSAGNYQVIVNDKNGCDFVSNIITITAPDPLTVALNSVVSPSCNGVNDGSISVLVEGGTPPYNYSWNMGNGNALNADLGIGTYVVTITDANNCVVISDSFQVTAPNILDIEVLALEGASCEGVDDGHIELSINGGSPPFDYQWSNGETTSFVNNLGADMLWCTISDANGCFTVSDTFIIEQPQLLNVNEDLVTNVRCFGAEDGNIFITVNGQGTPPYSYEWSDGAITEDRIDIGPGLYSCQISDVNGCTFFLPEIEITSPDTLQILVNSIEDVFCAGDANGSIDISAMGGVPPYSYSWDTGDQMEDLVNISAGVYKLTILDQNDCAVTSVPLAVNEPTSIEVEITNIEEIDCNGNDGGVVEIGVEGGLPPYDYLWSNNDTTQNLNNVPAGKYVVTITDQNDCVVIIPQIEVVEPTDSLMVMIDTIIDVSCHNASDGVVAAGIIGGTPPYQFLWNNAVDTATTLNDLEGGVYQITITDQNGCVAISSEAEVEEPFIFFAQVDSLRQPTCAGDSTGGVFISVAGGIAPYTYSWQDTSGNVFSNSEDAENLPAGIYQNMISDSSGCSIASVPMTLSYADTLEITLLAQESTCTEDSTGQLEIAVTGGQFPYDILWNNGATDPLLGDLGPGLYHCSVADDRGCVILSDTFQIDSLSMLPLSVSLMEKNDVLCKNEMTGSLSILVEGGTPEYEYYWNSGQDTSAIQQLPDGIYSCIIIDQNGCSVITPDYTISEPEEALAFTLDSVFNNSCPNEQEGGIFITPVGGIAPYEFSWSNNDQTEDLTNAGTGAFNVLITDQNECSLTSSAIFIEGPPDFLIQGLSTPTLQGENDGTATVNVLGATPPYTYLWDQAAGNQTTATAINLEAGTYQVTIRDSLECDTTVTVIVDLITASPERIIENWPVVLYPNPSKGVLFATLPASSSESTILWTIYNSVGQPIRKGKDDKNSRLLTFDLTSVESGVYIIEISKGENRGIFRLVIQR